MRLRNLSLILIALTNNVAHAAPGVITYAVIGAADPNKKVTTLNGVAGAGVSNVDMPLPIYILKPGIIYTVTIGAQNTTFSGNCVASYALGSGATGGTNISNWTTASYSCPATSIWTFPFPVSAIPNTPGPALLTATVKFGTTAVVTKIPLLIQ
jgi:hypothetical protein